MVTSKYSKIILTIFLGFISTLYLNGQQESQKLPSPVLVTSCGQSPGALKMEIFLTKAKINSKLEMLAGQQALHENKYKSLVIISGVSQEAMKAAGVTFEMETKRVENLIKEARNQGIKIVIAHLEGKGKRDLTGASGGSENESLISQIYPKSDLMIVRSDGNEDDRFTLISQQIKKPLKLFHNNHDLEKIIKDTF